MRLATVLAMMLALSGCRHFVVEREAVSELNDKDWTIRAEPGAAARTAP